MHAAILLLLAWAQSEQPMVERIALSGRVVEAQPISERLRDPLLEIAPGAPPLLAFRYFDGADRHRFGKLDLMVDDAGH
jgi:hypothetical protein